jgi:cation transport protein ChaC
MALRVAAGDREEVVAYLREREQATMVYVEAERRVRLDGRGGETIDALTYLVDRRHPQYAGVLSLERQVEIVRDAAGQSGPNPEYVLNTLDHLRQLGIRDAGLEALGRNLAPR